MSATHFWCWFACLAGAPTALAQPLRFSAYATAADVLRDLGEEPARRQAVEVLRRLHISRVFLEGRRGDAFVPPAQLGAIAEALRRQGFQVAGGIATVPGRTFGVRQTGALNWLNFQAEKTQQDIAAFFRDNAPLFEELIVDDFYCTADTSPESERARAERSWSHYRQDLLLSLVEPMMLTPARAARPGVRVIIKYPQWYDRFHLFGYDPARLSPRFDAVWVGTEVRNPETPRMGYVQPTQGYVNFRWLRAVAGEKVQGAWFDHIECTAQNFLDQAWQSVLAGARELTLFHLGDLMQGHPGHALLLRAMPDLTDLAAKILGREPAGVAFYKPPGSESEENMYLMDYLGMLGVPLVPAARYPARARVVVLGVQAAADPSVLVSVRRHIAQGARVVLTPALLRRVPTLCAEAGVAVSAEAQPTRVGRVRIAGRDVTAPAPLEVDAGLKAAGATVLISAPRNGRTLPVLARRGELWVWNVRTFNQQDFRETGEWLLPPKPLGWSRAPQPLADALREALLAPLGIRLRAPAGVAFYRFGTLDCLYNFREEPVSVRMQGKWRRIEGKRLLCGEPL